MTEYTQIRYEVADRIARITLDRPQYRNAQSHVLLEELDDAFARAADDLDVRVITLWGAGDHFSAGHDLGTPEQRADIERRPVDEGLRGRYARSWQHNIEKTLRWRNLPKPTVAVVQGYCIFAGWMVASAMDVIFAAEDALFLGANFQYFSIPWDLHHRKVREILFESRFIDAHEAHEYGLVNRVVPRDRLEAEVLGYASRVAENDPFQLRMIKQAVNQVQDTQGFTESIVSGFNLHILSSTGESDPGYALRDPRKEGTRRRPMVQRALENFEAYRDGRNDREAREAAE